MGLKKFLKKAGKVVKKVAPLAKFAGAAGLTTLIPGGGAVLGAMKMASKLKSAGKAARDVMKPELARIEPPHITAMINRSAIPTVQPRAVSNGSFRPVRAVAASRAAPTRRARRSAPKAPSQKRLAAIYDQYIAEGRPGEWSDYARSQL